MYCLLVYTICFPTYSSLFPYLSPPVLVFTLRIDPLRFQAGCCKRWLKLALFFCIYNLCCITFFWLANARCCCVVLGLVLFHTKPRDWLGETSPRWPILCQVGRKTTTQSDSGRCVRVFIQFYTAHCWLKHRATSTSRRLRSRWSPTSSWPRSCISCRRRTRRI